MIDGKTRVSPSPDQVSCDLGEMAATLNIQKGDYHEMNPVARSIWKLAREEPTVDEILKALLEEYDVAEDECRRDLIEILEKMNQEGLVVLK